MNKVYHLARMNMMTKQSSKWFLKPQPCKNLLNEQNKFWNLQTDNCDYKKESWLEAVKTEMIGNKFAFGICDENHKECLLQETEQSDYTYTKVSVIKNHRK